MFSSVSFADYLESSLLSKTKPRIVCLLIFRIRIEFPLFAEKTLQNYGFETVRQQYPPNGSHSTLQPAEIPLVFDARVGVRGRGPESEASGRRCRVREDQDVREVEDRVERRAPVEDDADGEPVSGAGQNDVVANHHRQGSTGSDVRRGETLSEHVPEQLFQMNRQLFSVT